MDTITKKRAGRKRHALKSYKYLAKRFIKEEELRVNRRKPEAETAITGKFISIVARNKEEITLSIVLVEKKINAEKNGKSCKTSAAM